MANKVTWGNKIRATEKLQLVDYIVTEFSNDETDASKSADKLITERAAKLYADNSNTADTGNSIILSGSATWSGTGLIFDVTACRYILIGVQYNSAATQKTLATANPTNPRIDVIYLDNTGSVGVMTGAAGINPIKPVVDPASQIELSIILVPAGATTPTAIANTFFYNEGTEATNTTNVSGSSFAYTTVHFSGTKSTKIASFTNGKLLSYRRSSITKTSDFQFVKFYIYLTAAFNTSTYLSIYLYNFDTPVSQAINITTGLFGFNRTLLNTWQLITIPVANFALSANDFDTVWFRMNGANTSGFALDYLYLQSGTSNNTPNGVQTFNGRTGYVLPQLSDYSAYFLQSITGAMVNTALGYTPYNEANPSGYITASSTDTLTNKTWNGAAIAPTYGGTGLTSYTTGDLLYASATNVLSKLAAGTNGYVLTMASGVPTWTASTGGSVAGSNKQIQFNNSGAFGASANFAWDNTNKWLALSDNSGSDIAKFGGRTITGGEGFYWTVGTATPKTMYLNPSGALQTPGDIQVGGTLTLATNAAMSFDGTNHIKWNRLSFPDLSRIEFATAGSVDYYVGSRPSLYYVYFDAQSANGGYWFGYGASGSPENQSALVQIDSTTKGFLPPRMTSTQLSAIASPAEGLLAYDTTLHGLKFYNGTAWTSLASGSGGSVAGSNTQLQFNNSGAFGADSTLTFDTSTKILSASKFKSTDTGGNVAYEIQNGSAFRGTGTGTTNIYFDGNAALTGTINFRATNLLFSGYFTAATSNIGILEAWSDHVSVKATNYPSFRIHNTTTAAIWYFETHRIAASGSLEITNDIGGTAPCLNLMPGRNIGIGTYTPSASAQVDIVSTTRGFLPPRMTSTQIAAIASPAEGLIGYDTTNHLIKYYDGSIWTALQNANGWTFNGNAGTSSSTNFIGTTDSQDLVFKANNAEQFRLVASTGITKFTNEVWFAGTSGVKFVPNGGSPYIQDASTVGIVLRSNNNENIMVGHDTATRFNVTNINKYFGIFPGDLLKISQFYGSTQSIIIRGTQYVNHLVPYFDIIADGYAPSAAKNMDLRLFTTNATSGIYGNIILGYNGSATTGKIGIGNPTPAASALLDIASTTLGVLLPRMTTTQKNAIASPAEGLEVYDLTLHQKSYYNGSTWINY